MLKVTITLEVEGDGQDELEVIRHNVYNTLTDLMDEDMLEFKHKVIKEDSDDDFDEE